MKWYYIFFISRIINEYGSRTPQIQLIQEVVTLRIQLTQSDSAYMQYTSTSNHSMKHFHKNLAYSAEQNLPVFTECLLIEYAELVFPSFVSNTFRISYQNYNRICNCFRWLPRTHERKRGWTNVPFSQ